MGTTLIRLEDVTKVYNRGLPDQLLVLDSISLEIPENSMLVLKGPSGSGKTTLLSLIGCMARPTSGRIEVAGRDVAKLPERFLSQMRREIFGFIFQQFNLIRDLSVFDNVLLPLYPSALTGAQIVERANHVLSGLHLEHRKKQLVRRLSGGEQQRVAIARALVTEPRILIADEPTAHLDPELSREMMETLSAIKHNGTTVVVATHDPFVYENDAVDIVVRMQGGRTMETGSQ